MIHKGEFLKGPTIYFPFNTSAADGTSNTIGTNGTPKVYKDGGTTEITTGVSLVEDHDGITGRHFIAVDTSQAGFTMPGEYDVCIDGNTIDGKSVSAYDGTTKVASVQPNWNTNPDTTSVIFAFTLPPSASSELDAIAAALLAAAATAPIASDVKKWNATNVTTPVVAGSPVVTVSGDLSSTMKTSVNAEVLDVLTTDTFSELAAVPAADSSLKDKITWLFMKSRNLLTQTSSAQVLKADNGTTTVGTSTVSDDGTTASRGKFA